MKINVVCVGNLKENYLREAAAEYAKRISAFATLKIIEIKEEAFDTLARESKGILAHLTGFSVATAIGAREISSTELAEFISKKAVSGISEITFVIGGSTGLSEDVLSRVNEQISFGRITLPHQLFRVVLLEQIYRAFSIINHSSYHK